MDAGPRNVLRRPRATGYELRVYQYEGFRRGASLAEIAASLAAIRRPPRHAARPARRRAEGEPATHVCGYADVAAPRCCGCGAWYHARGCDRPTRPSRLRFLPLWASSLSFSPRLSPRVRLRARSKAPGCWSRSHEKRQLPERLRLACSSAYLHSSARGSATTGVFAAVLAVVDSPTLPVLLLVPAAFEYQNASKREQNASIVCIPRLVKNFIPLFHISHAFCSASHPCTYLYTQWNC